MKKSSLVSAIPILAIILLAGTLIGCSGEFPADIAQIPTGTAQGVSLITPSSTRMITPTVANTKILFTATVKATSTSTASTPTPSEKIPATKVPTKTRIPTRTRPPTRTPTPSATPTITPIPPTPAIPEASIKIYSPAPLSRMISPVQIYAAALAGANGNVSVDLLGEDGRQIYTEKIHFNTASGARVGIERQIPFSLSGVAEEGCLRVYSLDEYNRLVSLGSSKIILLSVGENDPITDIYQQEPFYFLSPRPMDAIRGGIVEIKGIASYVTQNPLLVELVDSSGQVIASDLTNQLPSDDPKRVPFQSVLKYQITTPTWVRLIIHERDLRLNMDLAASSMLIKIIP